MEAYLQTALSMLAVINPVVCGIMFVQIRGDQGTTGSALQAVKTMLTVWLILITAALAGHYILGAFGISMDAFKIVGGIILAYIGLQMISGPKQNNNESDQSNGLNRLIMFAASPGTITMVITLAAVHDKIGIPVNAIIGTSVAVVITTIIIILMERAAGKKKASGQTMVSKFMGLIIVAMGVQFLLDGIKDYFF